MLGATHGAKTAGRARPLRTMQHGGFLTRATATLFVLATVTASTDPGPTVIVKLGGSAVSRKDKFETLNQAALTTTARQIRASCGDARVLLVHGCGSFGHFQAHEYGISKGTAWPTFSWLGLARTRRSATKLNALILDALLAEELPAVHLSPFPLWRKRAGKPTARTAKAGVRHVRELLRAGLMPVMHGDCVVDERDGCGILSGDALLEALCLALRPKLAVFLTDVPGVFSRPPSEQGAELIPEINVGRNAARPKRPWSQQPMRPPTA